MGININTKILLSIASIMAAAALIVGATFAFFSDEETSSNNIFAAGDLDLQLDDEDESFTDGVTASIGGSDLAPGDTVEGFISLHNDGSVDAAEVILGANQTANDNNGDGSDLADVLELTIGTDTDSDCEDPTDLTADIAAAIGDTNAPLLLIELVNADYNALSGLTAGETYYLCITATLDEDAGNVYQGDSKTIEFVFTANQNDTV